MSRSSKHIFTWKEKKKKKKEDPSPAEDVN